MQEGCGELGQDRLPRFVWNQLSLFAEVWLKERKQERFLLRVVGFPLSQQSPELGQGAEWSSRGRGHFLLLSLEKADSQMALNGLFFFPPGEGPGGQIFWEPDL